jgi:hypothetical protein
MRRLVGGESGGVQEEDLDCDLNMAIDPSLL